MKCEKLFVAAASPGSESSQPQGFHPEDYKVAAWLMFGLTVSCLVFIAYMVTIDKVDLVTGVSTTLGIVTTLNIVVFRKRVSSCMRGGRRVTARIARAAANRLDIPPASNA
ncbi:hypothetical protein ACFV24_32955 [Nocardia fluminea]|uniref:hypothetical protein n=1 Tax=Nocardia fluminea TaxID=134984 RepID=UPI00366BDDD0